ncbi:MAG: alpha-2-macroglobulin family protein [Chitinophagaceae bacterium]
MRNQWFSLTTLVVVIFVTSCNRNAVNLDYTNAKGEVQQLGNLIFRFNKGLVKDSLLNQWDSAVYVSFEPKIPGRFRWEHPDELVFSPSQPLPPATTFKASFGKDLFQYSKFDKVANADKISFSTADLKLDNTNITWIAPDERTSSAAPQVDLYFNYPVNPASLHEKIKLQANDKEINYSLQTLSASNKISILLTGLKMEDKDLKASIVLAKGIVPEGGVNGTKESIESSINIPSPYNLAINDVNAEHDGSGGIVYVRTSQQVVLENISSYIKFSPAVKFTTERTDDGFSISSNDFNADKSYLFSLTKGMRGRIGGTLQDQYDNNIAFGELEPAIRFVNSKGIYLSSKGNQNLEVRITNMPKIKVIISKIYESNLLAAQRYGFNPADDQNEDEYYYGASGAELELGDVVFEKEIDTRSLPKYGNSRLFKFNPEDKLAEFKGIYHIKIRSMQDYWVADSRFISMSDLGLIAKEGKDKMIVFANSIKSAQAVNGVNVIAYGVNNQVLGNATTNADGVAEITYARKEFSGFRPAMIIAKTAEDFNYLPFNTTRVNTSRFETGGRQTNSTGLDAFIYAERDIYRPGEKINFSVILRNQQWKSPGELPVKMKFLQPNGKELKSFRKTLNAQGSLEGDVDISTSAITGSYSLEVYTSNDILLGSTNFSIEEFVPDRIKVNAKLDKDFLLPGQSTTLTINAVNFFGPPAANRNYEYEVQVKQKGFNPQKYSKYDFGVENAAISFEKVVAEGTTDENGNSTKSYSVPASFKNTGLLQANFYATVFDETGRPVSKTASANIFTQDIFFGIANDGYWYQPLNQPIRFPLIAVDKNEKLISGNAAIKVIKHEYKTVLTKNGDYFRYESQKEDRIVAEQTMAITGDNAAYTYVPRSPGNYEIRVSIPGASSYVSSTFYSYGFWGGSDNTSFEVNTEGNIDISLDKSSYNTGETVKALFKTPFSGRMLITMETDKLVSYQYVNVEKRSASVDLKLTAEHLPNAYITATLIKPHDISDIPLTVAHGFQNVKVEEKGRKMEVAVVASKSVRSRSHQKVTVKATPGSFVTLAAVDNGVLQVSGFSTPNPYDYFYAQKALGVNAYDMYPLLFPELRARLSSTGGDGDLEANKRSNPMPAKRIKIVSYWSGIQKANGSGEANFEFDIPQFSGEVRLMAVAYKDESFGSSESAITVADPIVLSASLPRFLSPKDTITVPVTITNTTSKATSATAKISVTGPVQVVGNNTQTVSINANSENRATFQVVAAPTINVGKITVEVNSMGEKFTEEMEISIRPASPLQIETGNGVINGGGSQKIAINTANFIAGSTDYKLVLSKSPALELGRQLRYLIQYPYGCTEQTISVAFPQLYFDDIAEQMSGGKTAASPANYNITEAIRKIKLRQLFNGGLTLWDGEGTEHWWASVYAAHFLLEAQKAGFEVDNSMMNGLINYINTKLKNRETILYYYNQKEQKKIAPKEVAYSLYVLALAGKPNVPVMNYYKANPQLLSLDSKYLLSVSYAIAGDKQRFKEILPPSFNGEVSVTQTGGSLYSEIRDESVALNALIDADPNNAQIGIMAKHVADKLNQRYWYSTQECAFSFLALGKIAKAANKATVTAEIKVNGKIVGNTADKSIKLLAKQLGGTNIEIQTKGQGRLYYFWQSEGISATGDYKEEDKYIKVRKKFFDRTGKLISGNNFKQNELVIVQLSLENLFSNGVENIVITDLLPAGFEIENPRTKEIPGMDWIKNASYPTAMDVRDDRINLFVDLNYKEQVYYYAVRAVSPGVYRMGPVSADAMYNGEYHSYHGAGVIRVVSK